MANHQCLDLGSDILVDLLCCSRYYELMSYMFPPSAKLIRAIDILCAGSIHHQ